MRNIYNPILFGATALAVSAICGCATPDPVATVVTAPTATPTPSALTNPPAPQLPTPTPIPKKSMPPAVTQRPVIVGRRWPSDEVDEYRSRLLHCQSMDEVRSVGREILGKIDEYQQCQRTYPLNDQGRWVALTAAFEALDDAAVSILENRSAQKIMSDCERAHFQAMAANEWHRRHFNISQKEMMEDDRKRRQ